MLRFFDLLCSLMLASGIYQGGLSTRAPKGFDVLEDKRSKRVFFEIVEIIGINGSPTCGVELTWTKGEEAGGPGVFVRILVDKLNEKGISAETKGIRAYRVEDAVRTVRSLLGPG
jgi:hypothetical protein